MCGIPRHQLADLALSGAALIWHPEPVLGRQDLQIVDGWLVIDTHLVDHHRAWAGAEQRAGPGVQVDAREKYLLLRTG